MLWAWILLEFSGFFGIAQSAWVDLRPLLQPVQDQGLRNTCSAFAATALAEAVIRKQAGRVEKLSESYVYWKGREIAASRPLTQAMYAESDGLPGMLAVEALQEGVVLEREWPYERDSSAGRQEIPPPGMRPQGRFLMRLVPRAKIGADLLKRGVPVVMNLQLYTQDVQGPTLPKSGRIRMPSARQVWECEVQGLGCSGHVVLLVGYDSKRREFLFRNSWGEAWGNGGYGILPEAYLLEHCEACSLARSGAGRMSAEELDFLERVGQGASLELEVDLKDGVQADKPTQLRD